MKALKLVIADNESIIRMDLKELSHLSISLADSSLPISKTAYSIPCSAAMRS